MRYTNLFYHYHYNTITLRQRFDTVGCACKKPDPIVPKSAHCAYSCFVCPRSSLTYLFIYLCIYLNVLFWETGPKWGNRKENLLYKNR